MLRPFLDPNLLAHDPIAFFVSLLFGIATAGVAMLLGIAIHECSHAFAANYLGDPTAKNLGRLTLNPIKHLDPVGTLMILLAGFGWGKPVPVNPYYLRGGMAKGMAIVSLAGPLSNLILASIAAMVFRFRILGTQSLFGYGFPSSSVGISWFLVQLFGYIILINLILAVFNLLPIAPLDGFKIALGILPRELSNSLARTEQYGMVILLMLFAFDWFFNVGIFSRILGPIISGLEVLLIGR